MCGEGVGWSVEAERAPGQLRPALGRTLLRRRSAAVAARGRLLLRMREARQGMCARLYGTAQALRAAVGGLGWARTSASAKQCLSRELMCVHARDTGGGGEGRGVG